ncbi:MAG: ATP-binding protein [Gammaproteobacteria bacterium]
MDNRQINQCLINGNIDLPGVLPHLDSLKIINFIFEQNFGLPELPIEPGVILIRGPRQYGKSTWLEQQIFLTIKQFGKGSAIYLNGDEIKDYKQLIDEIRILISLFSPTSDIKRLFIDEITAIPDWQKAIKRLVDAGELNNILLVTTGSKATDLRRGFERLPGRKGKLARTNYIFTPVSYKDFKNKCGDFFKSDTLFAYILSGGSPIGANALATTGKLPEYIVEIINDWISGEVSASGRSRSHLLAILQSLYRMAATPIGQAKLARESGLSNNTVALGYIELLSDLMTVVPVFPYDIDRKISIFRKPCKYHFINLLMALCWHPKKPRTINELKQLGQDLGSIFEWTVAQEIWRKLCISSTEDLPDHLNFWQSKEHEIDFILPNKQMYIEVKSGACSPTDFIWFLKSFNKSCLTVINKNSFNTERIKGITLEDFLLY